MHGGYMKHVPHQQGVEYPPHVRREINQLIREGYSDFDAEAIENGEEPIWSVTFTDGSMRRAVLLWRVELMA